MEVFISRLGTEQGWRSRFEINAKHAAEARIPGSRKSFRICDEVDLKLVASFCEGPWSKLIVGFGFLSGRLPEQEIRVLKTGI